jgi:hypothetical protein
MRMPLKQYYGAQVYPQMQVGDPLDFFLGTMLLMASTGEIDRQLASDFSAETGSLPQLPISLYIRLYSFCRRVSRHERFFGAQSAIIRGPETDSPHSIDRS